MKTAGNSGRRFVTGKDWSAFEECYAAMQQGELEHQSRTSRRLNVP
jgi:hypothetical protein